MNYEQTLDYLFTRLPMFSRIGAAAYKKDLTNTLLLCDALGNPQHHLKTIHVAGTNGKGSTSHMLAAILQTGGYKTGLYTSPHLKDFRERIKVDGQLCETDFIIELTEKLRPLIEKLEPSFFEITVAMAFEYFLRKGVDVAVIEVGLGGRLDSTNVIIPEISVITNIGMDHMNLLGDRLEQIAFEKAGIIKKGIPVVIGTTLPETKPVFLEAAKESPIYFADEKRYVSNWTNKGAHLVVEVASKNGNTRGTYELDLPGIYQLQNLLTVLETSAQLRVQGWNIPTSVIQSALPQVKKLTGLHGRWETIHEHPTVVLDVGHNADGMQQIVKQLELSNFLHLRVVLGMVKDKEIDAVLQLLPKHATYYFTKAQIPRALNEQLLMQQAAVHQLKGHAYQDVNSALQQALAEANEKDLILVCGSVFVVGEVTMG